jgi:hypothetical protein
MVRKRTTKKLKERHTEKQIQNIGHYSLKSHVLDYGYYLIHNNHNTLLPQEYSCIKQIIHNSLILNNQK